MIEAAQGAGALAAALGVSPRRLRRVFTGDGSLSGPRAVLARAFAARHGLTLRVYVHPAVASAYLVSSPAGWWTVPSRLGGWADRTPCRREGDWSLLPSLEVSFASIWPNISSI